MVTVAVQELTFPLVSVTVNVTAFAPILAQLKVVLLATKLAIPQLSVELLLMSAAVILAVPSVFKFTEMFLQIAVGNVSSSTVTICIQVAVFPEASVAVQVTVVLPKEKATGALLVTEATEQLSLATGVTNTTPVAVHPLFEATCTLAGQFMVGFSLSVTVTVWLQGIETFPFWSVAVQTTVVLPIPNA